MVWCCNSKPESISKMDTITRRLALSGMACSVSEIGACGFQDACEPSTSFHGCLVEGSVFNRLSFYDVLEGLSTSVLEPSPTARHLQFLCASAIGDGFVLLQSPTLISRGTNLERQLIFVDLMQLTIRRFSAEFTYPKAAAINNITGTLILCALGPGSYDRHSNIPMHRLFSIDAKTGIIVANSDPMETNDAPVRLSVAAGGGFLYTYRGTLQVRGLDEINGLQVPQGIHSSISPDGRYISVLTNEHQLILWDVARASQKDVKNRARSTALWNSESNAFVYIQEETSSPVAIFSKDSLLFATHTGAASSCTITQIRANMQIREFGWVYTSSIDIRAFLKTSNM